MRSVAEHERIVHGLLDPMLARLATAEPETLPIDAPDLAGRVSAARIVSAIPLPPFDNSQMDGYAVRVADLAGVAGDGEPGAGAASNEPEPPTAAGPAGVVLAIGRTTAAGDPPIPHEPGTAAPVMTGAAIPLGADAVIPIERADPPRFAELRRAGDPPPRGTVRFASAPPAGEFVRRTGSDLPAGETLLEAGAPITAARIGLLANAGVARVPVRPRPRVLLVSTGDEVCTPGAALAPGRIYDANTPLLAAALRGAGAVVEVRRTSDSADALRRLVLHEGGGYDLLVTSGGISAGAYEVVKEALTGLGVEFAGLALQPGGPQGCGRVAAAGGDGLPALCFPGNPVSSALSAELFLLPRLRAYAGRRARRPSERLPLAHPVDSPPQKHQLRRGRVDASGRVHVTPPSSHLLADLAAAEVLAHIPVGVDHLPAGSTIEIWRLDD